MPNDTNRDDEQNFSALPVKRLPAEVLLDAICAVTEVAGGVPRPAARHAGHRVVGQSAAVVLPRHLRPVGAHQPVRVRPVERADDGPVLCT